MFPLTVPRLLSIMPRAGVDRAAAWIGAFEQAMLAFAINTPIRMAMYLAQFAHESCELTQLRENMHYSAAGLRKTFPRHFPDDAIAQRYAALGPEAIANKVYANRLGNGPEESGDGWTYRASGGGLTFKANYMACSADICGDAEILLKNPELGAEPEFGAAAFAWYWSQHKCNELADAGDFDGVSDVVNIGHKTIAKGDSNGFADREKYLARALEVLK
jgi:putative chitinase